MIRLTHLWRRKSDTVAAPFVPVLARVREMRGDAQWEPLSRPSQIQERADRVSQAREHITIPRLASERETEPPAIEARRMWLDLLGYVLVVIAGWLAFLVLLIAMLKYVGED